MKNIKVKDDTHALILMYQSYLFDKQGKKWSIDTLINFSIFDAIHVAMKMYSDNRNYNFDDGEH